MTAKLDPALCRDLASWCGSLANAPGPGDDERLRPKLDAIADQLTAAAALAERRSDAAIRCAIEDAARLFAPGEQIADRVLTDLEVAASDQRALDALPPEKRDEIARLAAGEQVPGVPVVGIGPADTAIVDTALDYYARCSFTSPRAEIARIRAMLSGPAPGSAPAQDGGGS